MANPIIPTTPSFAIPVTNLDQFAAGFECAINAHLDATNAPQAIKDMFFYLSLLGLYSRKPTNQILFELTNELPAALTALNASGHILPAQPVYQP